MDARPEEQISANISSEELENLTEKALGANLSHQHALNQYAQKLTAELQQLEELVGAITAEDVEGELHPEVRIPGAQKAQGLCPISEFLNPASPFFQDASRRSRHTSYTTEHSMKAKELDALAQAVRSENMRLQAYESQRNPNAIPFDPENNVDGINWTFIAEKVSSVSAVERTADQCRIKWIGDRHPLINHSNWSSTELGKLKVLVSSASEANDGKVDWVQISKELGTNRTPLDCLRHGLSRQRHVWHPEVDQKLAEAVKFYGTNNWNLVARFVSEDATANQCQVRYYRAIDPSRKRGLWTNEETERLKVAVAAYGNSWVEVAACIPNRTNEQCRERWGELSSLSSANIVWTEADDNVLLAEYNELGNRWTTISSKVKNGASGQQCRVRWEKLKRIQVLQQSATAGLHDNSNVSTSLSAARSQNHLSQTAQPLDGEDISGTTSSTRPKPRRVRKGKEKERNIESSCDASPVSTGAPDSHISTSGTPLEESTMNPAKRVGDDAIDKVLATKKRKNQEATSSNASRPLPGVSGLPIAKTASRKIRRPLTGASAVTPTLTAPVTNAAEAPPTAPGSRPKPRPRGPPKEAIPSHDVGSSVKATPRIAGASQGEDQGNSQGLSAPPVIATSYPTSGDSETNDLTKYSAKEQSVDGALVVTQRSKEGRGKDRGSRRARAASAPARQSVRIAARSAEISSRKNVVVP